jgi:hypothetical protein
MPPEMACLMILDKNIPIDEGCHVYSTRWLSDFDHAFQAEGLVW